MTDNTVVGGASIVEANCGKAFFQIRRNYSWYDRVCIHNKTNKYKLLFCDNLTLHRDNTDYDFAIMTAKEDKHLLLIREEESVDSKVHLAIRSGSYMLEICRVQNVTQPIRRPHDIQSTYNRAKAIKFLGFDHLWRHDVCYSFLWMIVLTRIRNDKTISVIQIIGRWPEITILQQTDSQLESILKSSHGTSFSRSLPNSAQTGWTTWSSPSTKNRTLCYLLAYLY